jgi:predicted anti-sigma-YlaC factor YlaD
VIADMTKRVLTCQELVELVTDYLEGTLGAEDRARFEEHLTLCEGCTNYVQQMRQTIQMVGRLSEESIAPPVRDEMLALFRNWKEQG